MVQKIPPPPPIANQDPTFNRWLLELTAILNSAGGIDPNSVAGLSEVIAQSAANALAITALQASTGGQSGAIVSLQNQVAALTTGLAAANSSITTLGARAQVLNGVAAPVGGTGNVNDWYADTVAKHVYVKTGVATWTLIV